MSLFASPPKSLRSKKFDELKSTGFQSTVKYKTPDNFVAVDESKQQWFVLDESDPSACILHSFSEIVEVEIVENSKTVITSSAGSAIGRGLVGGALFGGIGAIVGGSTATQTASTDITKLGVRIIIDNLKNPIVYINCIRARSEVEKIYATFAAIANRKVNL